MEKTNTQSPCSVFLVHRSLSAEEIQKEDVESLIATRMERFLSTHTLKFDLKGSEVMDAVTSAGRALGDAADSLGLTEEEDDTEMAEEGRKKGERIFLYTNSELEENCIDRKCDFLQKISAFSFRKTFTHIYMRRFREEFSSKLFEGRGYSFPQAI